MRSIQCGRCKTFYASDKASCPSCGYAQGGLPESRHRRLLIMSAAALFLVVGFVLTRPSPPDVTAPYGTNDALLECQRTLKNRSLNPEAAVVPTAAVKESAAGYSVTWPPESGLLLASETGALVPSSATCAVSRDRKRVTALHVNGAVWIGERTESP